ncbi:MAG TPA: hypothetical protein VF815_44290 [Myxococcaceae bacterium]
MRMLGWMMFMLGALGGTARAAECEWKPPKTPPAFTVEDWRGAELAFTSDAKWFQCAKKKPGNELSVVFTVSGENEQRTVPGRRITSYSASESLSLKDICEKGPGLKTIQAAITGKGELSRLDFTSPTAQVYCPRCEPRGRTQMLVLHTDPRVAPAGMYTFQAQVDEAWHKCALPGSTLELWLFAAPTRLEAAQMKEPTHKITGLEGSPKIKKSFARAPLCEGGTQWIGYELHGTGELQLLNEGRAVDEARCQR